jgi:sugar lactone lactonase YvrE
LSSFPCGGFYLGNLNTFPIAPGASNIYKITPSGQIKVDTPDVTTVLGVVFDERDRMYVLEMSPAAGPPTPFIGRVRRFEPSGSAEVIADGLALPTGMAFGPDRKLYVSNFGFGFGPGAGQIVRITVPQ